MKFVEDLREKESMATYMAILRLPRACYQSPTAIGTDFCNLCTSNKQHFTVPYHIKEYANQVSQSEVSSHFIV